jgi:hypothetical protein
MFRVYFGRRDILLTKDVTGWEEIMFNIVIIKLCNTQIKHKIRTCRN